jgi:uncharacterized membrane protein (Fun14 family)
MSALIPLTYQVGIGGIGGFIAGYAFKKFLKIVAVIVGLFILALIFLGYKGIITINFGELENSIANALGIAGQATSFIATIIALLPAAGSFGLGFFLGFKLG